MQRDFPLVSIVVPAYNHEDYVVECVESVLAQDYPNIELIVINDGSTDSTGARIEEFLKKNGERFRYVSKSNEGLVKTLNAGIRLSSGKYFCEIASDDILIPGSVRKRVSYMEENLTFDAALADAYIMEGDKRTVKRFFAEKKAKGFNTGQHTLKDLIVKDARVFIAAGIFRKTFLERLGGFDEDFRHFEDLWLRYQLALYAKVGYIDEPVMYYRLHGANVSGRGNSLRNMPEQILALEKLLNNVKDPSLKRLIERKLLKNYLKYLKMLIKDGSKKEEVLKTLDKAGRISPWSLKALYYRIMAGVVKQV